MIQMIWILTWFPFLSFGMNEPLLTQEDRDLMRAIAKEQKQLAWQQAAPRLAADLALTPTQQQQLKQLKADLEALKELERQQTQQQRDEHQAQLKAFQASLQKGQALSPDELQTLNLIRQQQRIMSQRLALSMKELLLPLSGMLSEAQKNTLKAHMKAMAEQKGRWFTKKDRPKPRHWARLLMSDAFQAAL